MTIGVLVVTYNRAALLEECLKRITSQAHPPAFVLVVNNASTDATPEVLARFPGVEALHLPSNSGGAGGFCEGMRAALHKDFDWLCLLDDDALMLPDSLSSLASITASLQFDTVVCAQLTEHEDDTPHRRSFRRLDYGMFVGFCLSRALIEKIGLPRGDYFIYWDDVEYSHRIRRAGGRIMEFGEFRMVHQDYSKRGQKKGKLLGLKLNYTEMPAWRSYYYVRNRLFFVRSSGEPRLYVRAAFGLSRMLLLNFLFQRQNFRLGVRGVIDGLTGRTGKRVSP